MVTVGVPFHRWLITLLRGVCAVPQCHLKFDLVHEFMVLLVAHQGKTPSLYMFELIR